MTTDRPHNARARLPAGAGAELRFLRSAWANSGAKARQVFLSELFAPTCDPPASSAASAATPSWFNEFVADRLQQSAGARVGARELLDTYRDWAREKGAPALRQFRLCRLMTASGFKRKKSSAIFWCDVRLRGER
jgi:hypothetical protein